MPLDANTGNTSAKASLQHTISKRCLHRLSRTSTLVNYSTEKRYCYYCTLRLTDIGHAVARVMATHYSAAEMPPLADMRVSY